MKMDSLDPITLRFEQPAPDCLIAQRHFASPEYGEQPSLDNRWQLSNPPMTASESIVQVINQQGESSRLVVVRVDAPEESYLVLRQQDWANGLGWFTQGSIELSTEQLGPLRCTLKTYEACRPPTGHATPHVTASKRSKLRIVS